MFFYVILLLSICYLWRLQIIQEILWCLYVSLFGYKVDLLDLGPYAIVTGATSGIGCALAMELATLGFSLILIGRSKKLLEKVEAEIRMDSRRTIIIETIEIDLGTDNFQSQAFKELKLLLEHKRIGLFVHAAGVSYASAQCLEEVPDECLDNIISVNLRSAIHLTRLVLPQMRQRKKGLLLFIGSGVSLLPCEPYYAAYVASKAGIEKFAVSLQAECAADNVIVQCHTPMLVATKMSRIRKTSCTVLSPENYARKVVQTLKISAPSMLLTCIRSPSWIHAAQLSLTQIVPALIWHRLRLVQLNKLRKRYSEKCQEKVKKLDCSN